MKLTTIASELRKRLPTSCSRIRQIDVRLKTGDFRTRAGVQYFGVIAIVPELRRGVLRLCIDVSAHLSISDDQYQNLANLLPHGIFPLSCSAKDLDTVCAPISAANSRALIPFASKSWVKES